MAFDYGQVIDRAGTYSMKWEDGADVLPFWVADMDIACAPAITNAVQQRALSPIYGYTEIPSAWADAYVHWFAREHGWSMDKSGLVYTNGIICGLSSLVRRFSLPAEKVIVLTPVYPIFFNSIVNNGRFPLEVPLVYEDSKYSIDFDRLEQAMKDPQASMMILCNPHNPTGNLWCANDLARIGDLAAACGVLVVSDEVHCDIVKPGFHYTPFASVNEVNAMHSITLLSPSKAFNVAGIHTAALYSANPLLRHRAWRGVNTDEVGEPNVFSIQTAMAAYNECADWLHGLQEYLFENRRIAAKFIDEKLPGLHCLSSNALYLLWIDASHYAGHTGELVRFLEDHAGIRLSDGADFHGNGDHFLRMNIACPRIMLEEGLRRLENGLNAWHNS